MFDFDFEVLITWVIFYFVGLNRLLVGAADFLRIVGNRFYLGVRRKFRIFFSDSCGLEEFLTYFCVRFLSLGIRGRVWYIVGVC